MDNTEIVRNLKIAVMLLIAKYGGSPIGADFCSNALEHLKKHNANT